MRLERAPEPTVRDALDRLHRADRLAGLIAVQAAAPVEFALALPTALLVTDNHLISGAAGVVADTSEQPRATIERARRTWGEAAIIVADVGASRHAAMEAGEFGADAVLFRGSDIEVYDCVAWWSQLFVLPVAADSAGLPLPDLARAGADFLVVDAAALIDGEMAPETIIAQLAEAERARGDAWLQQRERSGNEDQR